VAFGVRPTSEDFQSVRAKENARGQPVGGSGLGGAKKKGGREGIGGYWRGWINFTPEYGGARICKRSITGSKTAKGGKS